MKFTHIHICWAKTHSHVWKRICTQPYMLEVYMYGCMQIIFTYMTVCFGPTYMAMCKFRIFWYNTYYLHNDGTQLINTKSIDNIIAFFLKPLRQRASVAASQQISIILNSDPSFPQNNFLYSIQHQMLICFYSFSRISFYLFVCMQFTLFLTMFFGIGCYDSLKYCYLFKLVS